MNEGVQEAWRFFKGQGYSDAAVAGVIGHLMQENAGFDPRLSHDNGTGIGLAGWRDPTPGKGRKTDLFNYAKSNDLDPYERQTQFKFLDHELRTSHVGVFKRLHEAKSPDEAALAFMAFERPQGYTPDNPTAGHGWANRRANAVNVFRALGGSGASRMVGEEDVTLGVQRNSKITLDDTSPRQPFTTNETEAAGRKAKKNAAGFWGALGESTWDASPFKWAVQSMEDTGFDPDFRWSKRSDLLNEVQQDIPADFRDAFAYATSEKHARIIRSRILDQMDLQRRIAAGGWSATAGAFLGEILEPVGLAASFAVPEAAGVAKLGRVAKIAAGGATAAAANVALELPRYMGKETAQGSDLLWAGGAGMVMGGAFGALRRNPATQAEADALERVGRGLIDAGHVENAHAAPPGSAGAMAMPGRQQLHPEMAAWTDHALDAPETAMGAVRFDSVGQLKSSESQVARAAGGKLGLDGVGNKDRARAVDFAASEYQKRTHEGMMTRAVKEYGPSFKDYLKEHDVPWSEKGSAEVRFRSEVTEYIRNTDPSRSGDFSPSVTRMGDHLRQLTEEYKELLTDPGKISGRTLDPVPGFEGLQSNPNYIMRQVDHQKVFTNVKAFGDAQVAEAFAKGMRAMNPELSPELSSKIANGYIKRLHELSAGVDMKGDRAVSGHDLHAMREMLEQFDGLTARDVDAVLDIFKPRKGSDAGVSSRAKRRALFDESFGQKLTITDRTDPRFSQQAEFRLKDLFEDDAILIFENYSRQVSGLIGLHQVHIRNPRFTPDHIRPMQRGTVEVRDTAKSTDIVSTAGELNLSNKGHGVVVDAASFRNADPQAARELMEAAVDYASSKGLKLVSGEKISKELAEAFQALRGDYKVAFAKTKVKTGADGSLSRSDGKPVFSVSGEWKAPSNEPEFLVKGLSKDSDWETMMQRVAQSWDDLAGSGKMTHEARNKGLELDRQNLKFLRQQILGRTDEFDQTKMGNLLRRSRDYNFVRLMNNVGLAQLNEFAMVTSSVGLKASLAGMPAFRALWRNAKTGELDDIIARDIEYITSYGTDWVRGSLRTVSDDFGNPLQGTKKGSFGEKYDAVMEKAKRGVNAISGMSAINTALQRFGAKAVYAKFAHMADGIKVNKQRLAVMGVDDAMAERIFKSIRENRTYLEGATGKLDLPRMNLEKWADKEAAAHFQMAVSRWARYAVLENDPGQMSRIMGTWFGKVLFQFRTFVMGAWSRHLIHNIHMRDWQSAGTFLFTGLSGSLLHIAHSHLATLGRSDREEMLEKRLSWKSIALNGWARASYSSFLPAAIDTVGMLAGADPLFTRISGQATDAILGNPTVGLLNDAGAGVRGMMSSLWDDSNEISQADVRNLVKAFPFQNWIPLQALLSTMIKDLPEFDPKSYRR